MTKLITKPETLASLTLPMCIAALWFIAAYSLIPIQDIVQFGGDEGMELAKPIAIRNVPGAAEKMWNDQPYTMTYVYSFLFNIFGESVYGPRLFSLICSSLLLFSVTGIVGFCTLSSIAVIGSGLFLVCANIFQVLSMSAMQEIPALSFSVFSVYILLTNNVKNPRAQYVLSGISLGVGISIKLTMAVYVVAGCLIILSNQLDGKSPTNFIKRLFTTSQKTIPRNLIFYLTSVGLTSFTILYASNNSIIDLLAPHFKSYSLGESILEMRYEETLAKLAYFEGLWLLSFSLALLVYIALKGGWRTALISGSLFVSAIAFTLSIKPWWAFYKVHIWATGSVIIGVFFDRCWKWSQSVFEEFQAKNFELGLAKMIPGIVAALLTWSFCQTGLSSFKGLMAFEKFDEVHLIESMRKYSDRTNFVYAQNYIYALGAGRLLPPPELAVVSMKRFLSGGIDDEKLTQIIKNYRCEQVLVKKIDRHLETFLNSEYQLVEKYSDYSLYVHNSLNPTKLQEFNWEDSLKL